MNDKKNMTYKLLIAFIMIQPLLDIHYLYTDKVISIFKFSPSTIIRMIVTFILILATLKSIKDKRKWKFLIASSLIITIYTICHHVTNINFNSLVPGDFNYSLKSDLFYIIRMCIPLVIIFITYSLNITNKDFFKVIKVLLVLISGSIVITNIFKMGLTSYTNEIVKDNIFGWFNGAYEIYNYSLLASKGWFNFANQISALLVLLLPVMIYITTVEKNIFNILIVLMTILSMIMLGTKVALLGCIITIFVMALMIIVFKLINRDKSINKLTISMFGIALILIVIIVPKAPALNREITQNYVYQNQENAVSINNEVQQESDDENNSNKNNEANNDTTVENDKNVEESETKKPTKNDLIEFIGQNYSQYMINPEFIENSYPYKYDPEFWLEIMEQPIEKRMNYRYVEESMLKRAMEINNDSMDKVFGMSYSRTQNIFNLERDFVNQYYSMGIIGIIIFILPYIAIILYSFFVMLFKRRKKFNLFNVTCLFSLTFMLAVSVYSGNVIDALTVVIVYAFLMGKLLKNVRSI